MSQKYQQSIKMGDEQEPESTTQGNTSLLSPHNSVFAALNNPELGNLDISRINSRNVCDSPVLQQQGQAASQFNEFSSWHLVQQNSNASSYNNLSGPSSILSSSDAEENQVLINNYIEYSRQHHQQQQLQLQQQQQHPQQKQAQQQHPLHQRTDPVIYFDNEMPNSDDEELKTELEDNNSTIHQIEKLQMPSFIMPRMSMTSEDNSEDNDKLKVNVVGAGSAKLVDRLNLYNKILQNVKFNNANPDLIVLVVDQDNMLLSQQLTKPFIPVFISDEESSVYEQDLQSTMFTSMTKLCQPIKLKSFDDDLFLLINLLSNIDMKKLSERKLSSTGVSRRNSSSPTKKVKKPKKARGGNYSKRFIDAVYNLISDEKLTSKILLSIGYLGICFCGASFLLSKKRSATAAVTADATGASASIAEKYTWTESRTVTTPTSIIKKSTIYNNTKDAINDNCQKQFQSVLTRLENLIDNLIERGRLTGYWLYYNLIIIWD